MPLFSLSAVGVDRPGIVAGLSGALRDIGCNLEDSSMTILHGHFAVLLVVTTPEDVGVETLEKSVEPVIERFGLTVVVRHLSATGPNDEASSESADPWTISVHGADRPGIVHAVTSSLADA